MSIEKITDAQFAEKAVASLPVRPNGYGQSGLSSAELRAAFDALPALIRTRYNALVDAVRALPGGGALADEMKTGIEEGHTLSDFFDDVTSGALSNYMSVGGGKTLSEKLITFADAHAQTVTGIAFDADACTLTVTFANGESESVTLGASLENAVTGACSDFSSAAEALAGQLLDFSQGADFEGGAGTLELENGKEYDVTDVTDLTVDLPSTVPLGFASAFCFTCDGTVSISLPQTATLTVSNSQTPKERAVIYFGDDVTEGVFVPLDGFRYTAVFVNDGQYLNCTVTRREVPSET